MCVAMIRAAQAIRAGAQGYGNIAKAISKKTGTPPRVGKFTRDAASLMTINEARRLSPPGTWAYRYPYPNDLEKE